jgi:hypothetical protein
VETPELCLMRDMIPEVVKGLNHNFHESRPTSKVIGAGVVKASGDAWTLSCHKSLIHSNQARNYHNEMS